MIRPSRPTASVRLTDFPVGTAVRLRSVPYALECSSTLGRIAHPVAGWAGYYIVRLDQPARHVAFGQVEYLPDLRLAATDLELVAETS